MVTIVKVPNLKCISHQSSSRVPFPLATERLGGQGKGNKAMKVKNIGTLDHPVNQPFSGIFNVIHVDDEFCSYSIFLHAPHQPCDIA